MATSDLLPIGRLREDAKRLDRARPAAIVCAGGYRSSAASSILQACGFTNLQNVVGGTAAWKSAGYPIEG